MKTTFKLIASLFCAALALGACKKEAVKYTIVSDPVSVVDIPAHEPEAIVLKVTTEANWIVLTPSWVTATPNFGSGTSFVTLTVDENYRDENTNTKPRSGEVKIAGGGTSVIVPVAQLGFTKYEPPIESIGGIHNLDEFKEFAAAAASGQSVKMWTDDAGAVALLADIDVSSITTWVPIGSGKCGAGVKNDAEYTNAFEGVFDGNNHSITGINWTWDCSSETSQCFGFFGALSGATVKNLTIGKAGDKITVQGSAVAPVCISPVAASAVNSTLENVTNYVSVEFKGVEKQLAMAGIVAQGTSDQILGCSNYGDFKFTVIPAQVGAGEGGNMVAGIQGYMHYGAVKECHNYGEMVSGYGRAGGIIGSINASVSADNFALVEACVNHGTIQSDPYKLGSFGNAHRHGGIVGGGEGNANTIKDCVNEGNVFSQSAARVGGIVGHSKMLITGCENKGIILGDADGTNHCPGWLCGYLEKKELMKQCKMGGKVGDWTTYGAAPDTAPAATLDNVLGYNNSGASDPAEVL